MRPLTKRILVLSCAAATATAVFCLAACSGGEITGEPESPVTTHDPVTLEVDGRPGTYEPHNFVDGKCTMCDETTIFTQDSVAQDDIVTKECDQQGEVTEIKYTTDAYPDWQYADENGLVTKTAWKRAAMPIPLNKAPIFRAATARPMCSTP